MTEPQPYNTILPTSLYTAKENRTEHPHRSNKKQAVMGCMKHSLFSKQKGDTKSMINYVFFIQDTCIQMAGFLWSSNVSQSLLSKHASVLADPTSNHADTCVPRKGKRAASPHWEPAQGTGQELVPALSVHTAALCFLTDQKMLFNSKGSVATFSPKIATAKVNDCRLKNSNYPCNFQCFLMCRDVPINQDYVLLFPNSCFMQA